MKIIHSLSVVVPALLISGCASSPRYTAVHTVPADEVVVVPAPVSDRPVMRVYPEAPPVKTEVLPPGVSAGEHAIAETIRAMFNTDPGWAGLTDRVEVRVSGNDVHLRGAVASDSVRDRIEQKIRGVAGVDEIDNGLRVVSP